MREKLQTLPLVQLRELAKTQGIKGVTTLKKAELIERLCEKTDDKTPDKAVDKASLTGNVRQNLPGKKRRSRRSARPGLTSRETMEETKTILIIEAARITEETITGILPDAVIRRTTPVFMQEARKAAASRGQTEAM